MFCMQLPFFPQKKISIPDTVTESDAERYTETSGIEEFTTYNVCCMNIQSYECNTYILYDCSSII